MTKRQHPVGSDTTDLLEEDLVNQDASKVTKLSIEGLIASKGSDVVLTHPNSKSDCWKKFGHIEFGGRMVTDYVICKDCKVVYQYNPKTGTGVGNTYVQRKF